MLALYRFSFNYAKSMRLMDRNHNRQPVMPNDCQRLAIRLALAFRATRRVRLTSLAPLHSEVRSWPENGLEQPPCMALPGEAAARHDWTIIYQGRAHQFLAQSRPEQSEKRCTRSLTISSIRTTSSRKQRSQWFDVSHERSRAPRWELGIRSECASRAIETTSGNFCADPA